MKVRNGMTRKFMVPVLGVLLAALPAWAQQDGGQEERATTLEEVIVTAQKREERLQDTPISAVTFSDEDLQALGAHEMAVAVNYAPNVIVRKQSSSDSNYAFGIRGVTSGETALAVDPVVGLYVDGVYLGRMTGAALDIGDMERMEVLRGPQGSLYGRNTIAGAINMVPRQPGEEFEFSQHVGLGERGYKRSQTVFNSPVFGRGTSVRVNYIRDERDGLLQARRYANTDAIDNILDEEIVFKDNSLGERLAEAWRFSLSLNPQPGMRVRYSFEKNDRYARPVLNQIRDVDTLSSQYLALLRTSPGLIPSDQVATGLYAPTQVTARISAADLPDSPTAEQYRQSLGGAGSHYVTALGPYVGVFAAAADDNGNPTVFAPLPTGGAPASNYAIFEQAAQIADLDRVGYLPQFYAGDEFSDTDGHKLSIEWDVSENAVLNVISSYRTWDGSVTSSSPLGTGTDFGSFQVAPSDVGRILNIDVGTGPIQSDVAVDDGTVNVSAGEWVSLFRAGRSSDQQQFTQEIQLLGESADKRFKYALGLYYFEEKANENNPQYISYPGVSLPLVGGVSQAIDLDTRIIEATINPTTDPVSGTTFIPIVAAIGQANANLGALAATLTTDELRVLMQPTDYADLVAALTAGSASHTIVTSLTAAGFVPLREGTRAGTEANFPAVALAQHFQRFGSGSLCGDPDGRTYGITDLSIAFGRPVNSFTVANACLDKTILAGSSVFMYGTDNQAVAAYAQGALDLSDRVNLAVGLRYTIDKRSAYLRYSQVDADGDGIFGEVEDTVRASEEWDKGTYDITFNYRWLDDFSTYAKLATGYRAGGYNARASSAASFQTPVDAEELISYEFGWKFEGLGRTLRVNGALFKSDYEENQTSQFSPSLAGATSIITNAGDRKMEGAELELTWLPLAGLTWNLNLGYIDAYWDFYPERGDPNNPHDPNAVVPYSPEVSYSTILEYQLPPLFDFDIGNWAVRLEAQYQDEFSISPGIALGDPGAADDRTIVNLRLTLSDVRLRDGGRMSFSLWGKNITDEEYQEFPIPFLTFDIASFGERSSAGIDFRYEY